MLPINGYLFIWEIYMVAYSLTMTLAGLQAIKYNFNMSNKCLYMLVTSFIKKPQ